MNGRVISELRSQAGTASGGQIGFYTPNGLIIGSTATFDVGSLLLTTADPQNWFAFSQGQPTRFTAANAASSVIVSPGARINALRENAYVAIVSPRVEMRGQVRVDGSVAYVAAEQVDLSINAGLFDIVIRTGTSDPNGIVHSGSTGGPASFGPGDDHQINMVALPKNQAITMLLGGQIGYDAAENAFFENGEIRLVAGTPPSVAASAAGPAANILVEGGRFTSSVEATASGDLILRAVNQNLTFEQDLLLFGGSSVQAIAGSGGTLSAAGDFRAASFANEAGTGGLIRLASSSGGSIAIGGESELRTDGFNLFVRPAGAPPIHVGGTIELDAAGGAIQFSDAVTLSTIAVGDNGRDGFSAEGGSILVQARAGGQIGFAQGLNSFTTADAGISGSTGLAATGGSMRMVADNGAIRIIGALSSVNQAFGGASFDPGVSGGAAVGGAATLVATNGGTIVANSVSLDATGRGGAAVAAAGGAGRGGDVAVLADTTGSISLGALDLIADGRGGAGTAAPGVGAGGTARLILAGQSTLSAGATFLSSQGLSGAGAGSPTALAGDLLIDLRSGSRADLASLQLQATGAPGTIIVDDVPQPSRQRILLADARLAVAGDVDIAVPELSVDLTGTGLLSAGGDFTVDTDGATRIAVSGTGGLEVGGDFTVDAGTLVSVTHRASATNAQRPAGEISISAARIDLTATDLTTVGAALQAQTDVDIQVSRGFALGDVRAGNTVSVAATGSSFTSEARVAGAIVAPSISIRSADLTVEPTGQLGALGVTQTLVLDVNAGGRTTFVGGASTATGQGYRLDQAEFDRIRSAAFTLRVTEAAPILFQDLTIGAGAAAGAIASLAFTTAGTISVEGNVLYNVVAGTNRLALTAGDRIQVSTPNGSLRLRGAGGLPSGELTLRAANIWVAQPTVLTQLAANPNFEGRDIALLGPPATAAPRGFVEAGRMDLSVGQTLFVQNSGTLLSFAGLTTGTGGLSIGRTGQAPISVQAFGARVDAAGNLVTNAVFFEEVDFREQTQGFTSDARFNDCLIASGQCRVIFSPKPLVRQVIGGPVGTEEVFVGGEEDAAVPGFDARQELVDATDLPNDILVDESVTSGGETLLWFGVGDEACQDTDDDKSECKRSVPEPAPAGGVN